MSLRVSGSWAHRTVTKDTDSYSGPGAPRPGWHQGGSHVHWCNLTLALELGEPKKTTLWLAARTPTEGKLSGSRLLGYSVSNRAGTLPEHLKESGKRVPDLLSQGQPNLDNQTQRTIKERKFTNQSHSWSEAQNPKQNIRKWNPATYYKGKLSRTRNPKNPILV